MEKVIVIGCPGSGKSTFSKALAKKIGLPLFHLDLLYWNANKTTVSKDVFADRLDQVLRGSRWIIDGNYATTLETRIMACDTVFFLDYPLEICLEGIQTRKGKPRTDMPWVEKSDETDEEFVDFIKNYNIKCKPKVLSLLKKYSDRNIIIFRNRIESVEFLARI